MDAIMANPLAVHTVLISRLKQFERNNSFAHYVVSILSISCVNAKT